MRLTRKYSGENKIYENSYVKPDYESSLDWSDRCIDKLGQLEDIEEELDKLTFYGKVLQYPNKLMSLHFLRVYFGRENPTDIRIEFEVKEGFGNVFYHIWDYGKTWALTKEELL